MIDYLKTKKRHIGYAQKMRRRPTKAEAYFWERIKNKQLGVRFIRQHIVSGSIADFACPSMGLIIEIDGEYHEKQIEKDLNRDKRLKKWVGYETLRFTNRQVLEDIEKVIDDIVNWLKREDERRKYQ